MKMRKFFAGMAALAVAASAMAVSASALADNQKAYQFGGAQVTWGVDIDGDDEADTGDGVNGDTWLGTIDSGSGEGTISVPVAKGDVVDIYCLAWDSITDTPIFTATINGTTYDCYYNAETPTVSYTVEDDIDTLDIDIYWILMDGTDGSFNDWCGSAIVVTSGDAAEETPAEETPAEETPAEETPAEETSKEEAPASDATTTANPEAGAAAGIALAGIAVAGAALVASKRR